MANVSIVKRPLQSGETSYYVKWRDGAGKQRMQLVGRNCSVEAKDRAAEIRKQLRTSGGTWQPPDATTSLRSYVLEEWLPGWSLRPWTRDEYKRLLEQEDGFLAEHGDKPLAAIRRADVLKWAQKRALAGASRNTVRNAIAPLKTALAAALVQRIRRVWRATRSC